MTLHVLTYEHTNLLAQCYMAGGQDMHSAYNRAYQEMEIAMSLTEPTFFIGPNADNPKYFMGAYTDVTGRAYLTAGSANLKGNAKSAHNVYPASRVSGRDASNVSRYDIEVQSAP